MDAAEIKKRLDANRARIERHEKAIRVIESENKRLKQLLAVAMTEPLPLFAERTNGH